MRWGCPGSYPEGGEGSERTRRVGRAFREAGLCSKADRPEAGPRSQWPHAGLKGARFEMVLPETRHAKAALSAMSVKTDRKDAREIAVSPDRTQTASRAADRRGVEYPRDFAWFWAEGLPLTRKNFEARMRE